MDYQGLSIDELVRECAERPCFEAWQEFIRRFQPVIAKVALRACREWGATSPDVIEDRVQDTFVKIFADGCALLKRFRPRHQNSFLGYLRVITANLVYDYFRKEHPISEKTIDLKEAINPAPGRGNSAENEIFFNQVDNILRLRGNGPQEQKERAIFWLYYRHGMTSKAIASIPAMNLTVKGVESCLFRLIVYIKHVLSKRKRGENPGGIQPPETF